MTDYAALLNKRVAERTSTKEAGGLPPALEAHKFTKKEQSGGSTHEMKETPAEEKAEDKKEKKEAQMQALDAFTAKLEKLTEKTAAIVAADHNPVVEQLFRNMVSSAMNLKLAGIAFNQTVKVAGEDQLQNAFETPESLIRTAFQWTVQAADNLEIPLT